MNCYWSLSIFNFQVSVGALVLSRFIDSCIEDPQCCAEQSWPTAVTGVEACACWRCCPPQVQPTSARQQINIKWPVCTKCSWSMDRGNLVYMYLQVSSRFSDLFILWMPSMLSIGASGMNLIPMPAGINNTTHNHRKDWQQTLSRMITSSVTLLYIPKTQCYALKRSNFDQVKSML